MNTSLIRNLLTAIGGFFIGRALFGGTVIIDNSLVEGLIGLIMSVVGVVMSIKDKTVSIEQLQGTVRHIASTIGGILVGSGKMTAETITLWTGILVAIIPAVQGWLAKKKSQQLASGEIKPQQLKR